MPSSTRRDDQRAPFRAAALRRLRLAPTIDLHLHRIADLAQVYPIPARVAHAAGPIAAWLQANVTRPALIGPDQASRQWVQDNAQRIGAPFTVCVKRPRRACPRSRRLRSIGSRCIHLREILMKQNVGSFDRAIRISVGLVLIAASLLGYVGAWGWIGLLPLATGVFRICPAYLPFGLSTCAPQKTGLKR
jgi:hypothetical protein